MPRSRTNRSSSPQKPISAETLLVQKEREELFKNVQEMFITLDAEIVYNVLSECQWRGEDAIDKLLTIADSTEPSKQHKKQSRLHEIAEGVFGSISSEDYHSSIRAQSSTSPLSESDKVIRRPLHTSTSDRDEACAGELVARGPHAEQIQAFAAHFSDPKNADKQVDKIEMDLHFPCLPTKVSQSSSTSSTSSARPFNSTHSESKADRSGYKQLISQAQSAYSQQYDDAEGAQLWEAYKQKISNHYAEEISRSLIEKKPQEGSAVEKPSANKKTQMDESSFAGNAVAASQKPGRSFPVRLLSQSPDDEGVSPEKSAFQFNDQPLQYEAFDRLNNLVFHDTVLKVISEVHDDFKDKESLEIGDKYDRPRSSSLPFSAASDGNKTGSKSSTPTQSQRATPVSGSQPMTLPVIGLSVDAAEFVPRLKVDSPKTITATSPLPINIKKTDSIKRDAFIGVSTISANVPVPMMSPHAVMSIGSPVSLSPALSPALSPPSPNIGSPIPQTGSPMFITPKWQPQVFRSMHTPPPLQPTVIASPGQLVGPVPRLPMGPPTYRLPPGVQTVQYAGRMMFGAPQPAPVFRVPSVTTIAPSHPKLRPTLQGLSNNSEEKVAMATGQPIMAAAEIPCQANCEVGTVNDQSHIRMCVHKIQQLHKAGKKVMVIIRGLPGSGKSFLARHLKFDGVILSTDDFFMKGSMYEFNQNKLTEAHQWNRDRAKDALKNRITPVIVDNTNTQRWEFKAYVNMGINNNYHIEIMEPETEWKSDVAELARRNTHGVPKAHIERMKGRYETGITVEALITSKTKITDTTDKQEPKAQLEPVVSPMQEALGARTKDGGIVVKGAATCAIAGEEGGFKPQTITPLSWRGSSGSISSRTSSVDRASSSRGSPIPTQISRSGSPLVINLVEEAREPVKTLDRLTQPIRKLAPSPGISSQSVSKAGVNIGKRLRVRSGKKFDDTESNVKKKLSSEGVSLVEEIVSEHIGNKDLTEEEMLKIEDELKAFINLSGLRDEEIPAAEEFISLKVHGIESGDKEKFEENVIKIETATSDSVTEPFVIDGRQISDNEKEIESMDTITELDVKEDEVEIFVDAIETIDQQSNVKSDVFAVDSDDALKTVLFKEYASTLLTNVHVISEMSRVQSNKSENAQMLLPTSTLDYEMSYWGMPQEVPLNATWAADLESQEWEEVKTDTGENEKPAIQISKREKSSPVKEQRAGKQSRNKSNIVGNNSQNDLLLPKKVGSTSLEIKDNASKNIEKFEENNYPEDAKVEFTENFGKENNGIDVSLEQVSLSDGKLVTEDVCTQSVSVCNDLKDLSKHLEETSDHDISWNSENEILHVNANEVDSEIPIKNASLLLVKEAYINLCDVKSLTNVQDDSEKLVETVDYNLSNNVIVDRRSDVDGVIESDVAVLKKGPTVDSELETKVDDKAAKEKKKKNNRRKLAATFQSPFLEPDDKELFLSKDWSDFSNTASQPVTIEQALPQQQQLLDKDSMTDAEDFSNVLKLMQIQFVDSSVKHLVGKAGKVLSLRHSHSSNPDLNGIAKVHTNDKSTSTEELQLLSERAGMTFLQTCFPDVPKDELECVLENCDGNVDWTIEMLLTWEYSTPLSVDEKREFVEGMARVRRAPSPVPVKTVVGSHLQQPLDLLDICFAKIEKEKIASREEIEHQMIVTSKERLERIEDENITKIRRSLSLSDSVKETSVDDQVNCWKQGQEHSLLRALSLPENETTPVDINWSVLNEMTDDNDANSQLVSDLLVSSENESRKVVGNQSVCVVNHSLDAKHTCSDDQQDLVQLGLNTVLKQIKLNGERVSSTPDKDGRQMIPHNIDSVCDLVDNMEAAAPKTGIEKSEMDFTQMARIPAFTMKLTHDVISELENMFGPVGYSGHEGVPVSIDMQMSWALYQGLKQAMTHQEQLKQDEELARRLQAEEDQIPGGEVKRSRYKPTVPKVKSLSEIMEEERKAQSHDEEFQRMVESEGGHMAVATVVKRNKLYDKYPQIDRSLLDSIFQGHCFNLSETEAAVQLMLVHQTPAQEVTTGEAVEEYERQQVEAAKKLSVQVMLDQYLYQPVVTNDFQDGAHPMYEDFRGEANLHHRLRHECFQKAQEAFRRGLKQVASFYSQQGHSHTRKIKEANMRASEQILSQRRNEIDKHMVLDLHGFHADEAVAAVDKIIAEKEREHQKYHLNIITGRGSHSRGGVSKLRPTIIAYLQRLQYRYTETQTGVFKVLLRNRSPE